MLKKERGECLIFAPLERVLYMISLGVEFPTAAPLFPVSLSLSHVFSTKLASLDYFIFFLLLPVRDRLQTII